MRKLLLRYVLFPLHEKNNTNQLLQKYSSSPSSYAVECGEAGNEPFMNATAPRYSFMVFFFVPLLFSLPVALMAAEMATALPLDGGQVAWIQKACGTDTYCLNTESTSLKRSSQSRCMLMHMFASEQVTPWAGIIRAGSVLRTQLTHAFIQLWQVCNTILRVPFSIVNDI